MSHGSGYQIMCVQCSHCSEVTLLGTREQLLHRHSGSHSGPLDFQVEAQVYVDDVTARECGVYTASTSGWWIIEVTSSTYACASTSQSSQYCVVTVLEGERWNRNFDVYFIIYHQWKYIMLKKICDWLISYQTCHTLLFNSSQLANLKKSIPLMLWNV